MKQDRLISYMSDNFYIGKDTYRGNKFDNEILKRNIGKKVIVVLGSWDEVDNKYYYSELTIIPKRFIHRDWRDESQIPTEEKAFSKKQRKLVPNRFLWEIEPLTMENSSKPKMVVQEVNHSFWD